MKNFCLTSDEMKKINLELVSFTQFVNVNMSEQITGCYDCELTCIDGCISRCDGNCGTDCSGQDYYSPNGY